MALATTVHRAPVEVVRALLRATDALTDGFVEDLILWAFSWTALALARFRVNVLTFCTGSLHNKVVAFTLAGRRVPVKLIRTVVWGFGLFA